jgi:hypothetical protein
MRNVATFVTLCNLRNLDQLREANMYSVDRLQGLFGLQLADPLEGQISGISPRHNVLAQQPFLDHFDRPLKLPDHTLSEER